MRANGTPSTRRTDALVSVLAIVVAFEVVALVALAVAVRT